MNKYFVFSIIILFGLTVASTFPTTVQAQSHENSKILYLTCDADMTQSMLDKLKTKKVSSWYDPNIITFLKNNHIPATIFVTGLFAKNYSKDVAEWGKSGDFSIQNHSFDHKSFTKKCYTLQPVSNEDEKKLEISKTQEIISSLGLPIPNWFRFPGLCHNKNDDELMTSMHLNISSADVISGDAFNHSSANIIKNVVSKTKNNSVILFHLGGPNAPATKNAIQTLVPYFLKVGYKFSLLEN